MDTCLLARTVNNAFCRQKTLYYYVKDTAPEKVHINLNLLQVLAKRRETPLEAIVVLFKIFVLHIVLVLFVY